MLWRRRAHRAAAPLTHWDTQQIKEIETVFVNNALIVFVHKCVSAFGVLLFQTRAYRLQRLAESSGASGTLCPFLLQYYSTQEGFLDNESVFHQKSKVFSFPARGTNTHTHTACGFVLYGLYFYVGLLLF